LAQLRAVNVPVGGPRSQPWNLCGVLDGVAARQVLFGVRSGGDRALFFWRPNATYRFRKASVRRFLLLAVAVLPFALGTAACGDSLGLGDPTILLDSTADLATPTGSAADSLPSAFDIAGFVRRRPEQLSDAQSWDFALRSSGGSLRLIPNPFYTGTQRPLIARTPSSFASIERAPTARSAYGDTAVTLAEGAVYVMRSRHYSTSVGGTCYAFGKLEVVSLDLAAETATFILQVNPGCADDRLVKD
jgi:hypothetical protein